MGMAVKTSPTTAPRSFTVARNNERERATAPISLSKEREQGVGRNTTWFGNGWGLAEEFPLCP